MKLNFYKIKHKDLLSDQNYSIKLKLKCNSLKFPKFNKIRSKFLKKVVILTTLNNFYIFI